MPGACAGIERVRDDGYNLFDCQRQRGGNVDETRFADEEHRNKFA